MTDPDLTRFNHLLKARIPAALRGACPLRETCTVELHSRKLDTAYLLDPEEGRGVAALGSLVCSRESGGCLGTSGIQRILEEVGAQVAQEVYGYENIDVDLR